MGVKRRRGATGLLRCNRTGDGARTLRGLPLHRRFCLTRYNIPILRHSYQTERLMHTVNQRDGSDALKSAASNLR